MSKIIKISDIKQKGSNLYYEEKRVALVNSWNHTISIYDKSLYNAIKELFPGYAIIEKLYS